MNAGLLSVKCFVRGSGRSLVGLSLGLLILMGTACGEKKADPQPQVVSANNATNSMFQKMNQQVALPRPPSDDEDGGNNAAPAEMPELLLGLEESPECKGLKEERKKIKDQIDEINLKEVAPAAQKAEAASSDFDECQNDVGCVNSLDKYEAKSRTYQYARKEVEKAEEKVEALETQLYHLSQKMAAKCDTDPL